VFTGLIEDLGEIRSLSEKSENSDQYIEMEIATTLTDSIEVGDSVSVNGVCLTATKVNAQTFTADVMVQTLKLTSLKNLELGSSVNIELATTPTTRLGGHIVQGHVDGVGNVVEIEPGEKWVRFSVSVPKHLMKYLVAQGSIALDGVSLTVGELDDAQSRVTLWLIPKTLEKTNLSNKKVSDLINIEVDILAKYVERMIEAKGDLR
jgi:riboflavin synthase